VVSIEESIVGHPLSRIADPAPVFRTEFGQELLDPRGHRGRIHRAKTRSFGHPDHDDRDPLFATQGEQIA
jgi:hypothetical protein